MGGQNVTYGTSEVSHGYVELRSSEAPRGGKGGATRRSLTLLAAVAILIGLVAAPALATPPEVVDEGEFAVDGVLVDWMSAECGFNVYLTSEGTYTEKMFFDKDGVPATLRYHEVGKVMWTSDYGETWENYAANQTIDLVAGTITVTGNVWNLHAGAGGILINDSGRIVFGGPVIIVNGPHQGFFEEYDGLCDALAP
jgi:hypothetical protein